MLSTSSSNSLSVSINSKTDRESTTQQINKFLQFYLGSSDSVTSSASGRDFALLEAEIVTEIITVSVSEILSVPQMPYCVLGIYSWRSEMLWIVDLENLLGYPPSFEPTNDTVLVMVVQIEGQSLGLVIPQIDNIIEQDLEQFKAPSSEIFSEDVLPFLNGYLTDKSNNIVMLINAAEVFQFFAINPNFSTYK
ncbi:MAG: chemotaxis protein CheW [Xenococcaceae cyanobacterium MO_234.B1]|nr:chemotaxis protein CheW [Xenococcaceae cyanobacterium MO_234.B1]